MRRATAPERRRHLNQAASASRQTRWRFSGCSVAPDESLFPLAAGDEWNYRVQTAREDGQVEREVLRLHTLAPGAPDGLEGETSAWRRRSDSGMAY